MVDRASAGATEQGNSNHQNGPQQHTHGIEYGSINEESGQPSSLRLRLW